MASTSSSNGTAPVPSTSQLSPPSKFWLNSSADAVTSIRNSLSTFPSPPLRVSRVAQLDGALLDTELETILGGPLWKALAQTRGSGKASWEPELLALLRIAVLKMSLWDRGATYGSGLQNLKYRNERMHQDSFQSSAIDSSLTRSQKSAYMLLEVLPSYLQSRVRDRMLAAYWSDQPMPRTWLSLFDLRRRKDEEEPGLLVDEWKRVTWEVLGFMERLGAIASLVNFLVFLYDGKYRTLVDRILGMRLVYAQRSVSRNVSFEFLNRQLVWEAFTEFLLFLMPLINLNRLRLRASKLLSTTTTKSKVLTSLLTALPLSFLKGIGLRTPSKTAVKSSSSATGESSTQEKPATRPKGALYFLPPTTCPICYTRSSAPPTSAMEEDPTDPDASVAVLASLAEATGNATVKVPYVTDCGWDCRYCYYCVVENLVRAEEEGEDSWTCLRCGEPVKSAEREKSEGVEETVQEDGVIREKVSFADEVSHEETLESQAAAESGESGDEDEERDDEEDEEEDEEGTQNDEFESMTSDHES